MPAELEALAELFAGRYAVERELGRGGMATVYLAAAHSLHRVADHLLRWFAVLLGVSVCVGTPAAAQTRRALLIGINKYHYTADIVRRWEAGVHRPSGKDMQRDDMSDLYGPLNDVESMRSVLVARYQFAPGNIRVLRNAEAARDSILAAIRLLVAQAGAGDEVLFFYAGHGSQRYNSLAPSSVSTNHLDQTIVPADANAGQFDIRNVELTTLFDLLLRKGARLTLIFDSCNSGSAVRGALAPTQARYAPYDPVDAADSSAPESLTESARPNPALFIAASQEDQNAVEDRRTRHGVFTEALVGVLESPTTPVDASAEQILHQVQAILRSNGAEQVPVLRGTERNHDRPLIGTATGPLAGRITLPLAGIRRDTLVLDGGAAMAIGKGSELRLLDDSTPHSRANGSPLRIRIVAQPDLATSKAVVIDGTIAAVRSPALFLLERWRLPESANFYAWAPSPLSSTDLAAAARALAPLRSSTIADWTSDPTSLPDDRRPLYTVLHDRVGWRLRTPNNTSIPLASITTSSIEVAIQSDQRRRADSLAAEAVRRAAKGLSVPEPLGKPRLFVDLPPTAQLLQAFDTGAKVVWRPTPDSARYTLAGHLDDANHIEYSWISLNAAGTDRSPFPPRSDWTPLADPYVEETLENLAYGVSRVTYWLTVTPQDSAPFPYHLALRRRDAGPPTYKALGDTTPNYGGEQYDLVLRRDAKIASADLVEQQWTYVFIIDRDGRGQLLFGQSKNHMPPDSLGSLDNRREIPLPRPAPITICPSYGVDTFILVASPVPVSVPARVFNFPPIREASRDRRSDPAGGVPDNWSIERLSIVSRAPSPDAKAQIATGVAACRTDEQSILGKRQ